MRAIVSSASDGIYIRSVLEFALGTEVDHYIFTESSSAHQHVTKKGDGKLLWIQNRKDFTMVQVPTDSNMADINTKPLGGQRIRFLMNLIGSWRNEEHTKVGELERKVYEERRTLRRQGQQNCQDDCQNRNFLRACSQWFQKLLPS